MTVNSPVHNRFMAHRI